jgi:hypothetical protein
MNAARLIEQSDLLVSAMGRWPSFHDAKVLGIERAKDSCLATIHVFEMTDEVDSKGYFILKRHHIVTLRMSGVGGNSLPENYQGDVLSSLRFSEQGRQIRVDFESHMDNNGTVLCDRVAVTRVDACDADGHVY